MRLEIIEDINKNNIGTFKVFGLVEELPNLKDSGSYLVDREINQEAKEFSKRLRFDENQAIINRPLDKCWQDKTWNYSTAPYSYIATARKHGQTPEVITANLLVSTTINHEKYILLQQRSMSSGLYAGYYSIFGGSFSPKDDNNNLIITALRELKEEIDGIVTSDVILSKRLKQADVLLTQETNNGNMQFNFLGIEVELSEDAKGNIEEGAMVKIKESDIELFVANNQEQITPLALSVLMMYSVGEEV